ncbi:hypothetical protein H312_00946 [Anncaliia algerae PRA339]|uniref:C2H2-type domain-containing protein n=1 Tax=Anncaliia algerae PRA339 TaxID=1288291 RepID=A0A059F3G2_9MICR|nr:hypothetical protein H312_00946 [Anncaliia algerae PRA339]
MGKKGPTTKSKKNKSKYKKNRRFNEAYGPTPMDIVKESIIKNKHLSINENIISNGEFYCKECDRYFIDEPTLSGHKRTKPHKRRIKQLKEDMHSRDFAELAGGIYREKL